MLIMCFVCHTRAEVIAFIEHLMEFTEWAQLNFLYAILLCINHGQKICGVISPPIQGDSISVLKWEDRYKYTRVPVGRVHLQSLKYCYKLHLKQKQFITVF